MRYYIPEAAIQELKDYQTQLLSWVNHNLITTDQARKMHKEREAFICKRYRTQSDDAARPIRIQCYDCGRVDVVQSDVMRFSCVCSPNVERFTFQCREIDPILAGESPLEKRIHNMTGVRATSE